MKEIIESIFNNHTKKLLILPVALIIISLVFIISIQATTGEIFQKDVSLSGGTTITVYSENQIDIPKLENALRESFDGVIVRALSEFGTDKTIGVVIETPTIDEKLLTEKIQESTGITLSEENSSIEVVGSSLGDSFYQQMRKALIFAFVFMSIVVLITFRKIVPSLSIVLVALGDLLITISILNLANVRVSSAGIAALLLLIGYSIDTDVLLTTRILKNKEETIMEGLISSMKTGLTMTITTLSALTVAYFVSTSLVLKQMFIIVIIGLLVDIILTYMLNAPMLILYAKKHR
ncbi:MAG: hypothetical protein Q8Q42_04185 [Nanoarchaeota archaeon]|nr:hypothetical protein [Nanoarchaeota archaeon]